MDIRPTCARGACVRRTTTRTPWRGAASVVIIVSALTCAGADAQNVGFVENLLVDDADVEELLPAVEPDEEAGGATAPPVTAVPEPEVIRERYANRRVKIQREVIQDADQNYINHGTWRMWDEQGHLVMDGEYQYNLRHGTWRQVYRTREAKLLTLAPFHESQPPFVSQATFEDGKLNGTWMIYDANQRKLCQWEFVDGRRHGHSAWWYANGRKMREITYKDGIIDGELLEWDQNGKLAKRDVYEDGRHLAKKTEYYKDKSKQSEGTLLYPRLVLEKPDDWSTCTLATYAQEGKAEKHGTWTSWYPNGQRKLEGEYRYDVPVAKFVWWHANGQKSLEASYRDGKQHGSWTWWYDNGQKSIQGEYVNGDPSSKWLWWKDTGKVAQRADFSDPSVRIIARPPRSDSLLRTSDDTDAASDFGGPSNDFNTPDAEARRAERAMN